MSRLECAVAEELMQPVKAQPLLSIVIPCYNRMNELSMAVQSLADQLKDGLEDKVEIIISDNASNANTIDLIRALAAKYDRVSYVINQANEGPTFNFFTAPWRARGKYTWLFGSDDALMEGGIANAVAILEKHQPSFLTLNKQVANSDFTALLQESYHAVPDRKFDTMLDLFCKFGIYQFGLISASIESTEACRNLDPEYYLRSDCNYPHIAAYVEKHWDKKAYYSSAKHLVHRVGNSQSAVYDSFNFFTLGVLLPISLFDVMKKIDAPLDLFERVTGAKNVVNYDKPAMTMVDGIFENLLRSNHFGLWHNDAQRWFFKTVLKHCKPNRLEQYQEIWQNRVELIHAEKAAKDAEAYFTHEKLKALQLSRNFAI